jgi:hypothetical protein
MGHTDRSLTRKVKRLGLNLAGAIANPPDRSDGTIDHVAEVSKLMRKTTVVPTIDALNRLPNGELSSRQQAGAAWDTRRSSGVGSHHRINLSLFILREFHYG